MELTQEYLKSILHYNQDTGAFTWLRSRGSIKAGSLAGSIDGNGYLQIQINRKIVRAHRLAFLWVAGVFPVDITDHINGDRSDNRWANLRSIPRADNSKNMRVRIDNKSKVHGVYYRGFGWSAYINCEGNRKGLGCYKDWFEAVCARKSAEIKHGFHSNHGRAV